MPSRGVSGIIGFKDKLCCSIKPASDGLQLIIPFLYGVGLILPNQATACGRQRIVHRAGRIKCTERTEE